MANFDLSAEEVVLFEGTATSKNYKGTLQLTLTSLKIVIEQEKGILKKVRELLDIVDLTSVKFYNDVAQIKQHGCNVEIQTTAINFTLVFSGLLEARKFSEKAINAVTGTSVSKRVSDKTKETLDMVDATLGVDTRGTLKGILEKGIKGVLFDGIGKKK